MVPPQSVYLINSICAPRFPGKGTPAYNHGGYLSFQEYKGKRFIAGGFGTFGILHPTLDRHTGLTIQQYREMRRMCYIPPGLAETLENCLIRLRNYEVVDLNWYFEYH